MLETIKQTFNNIRDAIVEMGVDVDYCDSPTTYADKILSIGENEDGTGVGGRTMLFIPVFKQSETKPAKPTTALRPSDPTAYPSGWGEPQSSWTGKIWVSYTLVGNNTTYIPWTDPIPVVGKYCTCSGGGGDSGGGDGGSSGGDDSGQGGGDSQGGGDQSYGRSITGMDMWFKIHSWSSGITTPDIGRTPESENWTRNSINPTSDQPYLWCFFQINYNGPVGDTNYSYTRTPAFILRKYNSDSSQNLDELWDVVNGNYQEMLDYNTNLENNVLSDIQNRLDDDRNDINNINNQELVSLRNRLDTIENTGTTELTGDGLWGILNSYQNVTSADNDYVKKKAFSDIILDAPNAKATLQTGSSFFEKTGGGTYAGDALAANLTLDGLLGQINSKVTSTELGNYYTREQTDLLVNSSQISQNADMVYSTVSKGAYVWEQVDGDVWLPYGVLLYEAVDSQGDLIDWSTVSGLSSYEEYMRGEYRDTYNVVITEPVALANSANPVIGPFRLVSMTDAFSKIKQTADYINASLDKFIYVWINDTDNEVRVYDEWENSFKSWKKTAEGWNDAQYNEWCSENPSAKKATYASYVHSRISTHWILTLIGESLSDLLLADDKFRVMLANMEYVFKSKTPDANGVYDYQPYEWPDSQHPSETRQDYEDRWDLAGYEKVSRAEQYSAIDQTANDIRLTVATKNKVWIGEQGSGIDGTVYDYEDFRTEYDAYVSSLSPGTNPQAYELWVSNNKTVYLETAATACSQIKQTADNISSTVSGLESSVSTIDQRADEIDIAVKNGQGMWHNTQTDEYIDYFGAWDDYEDWCDHQGEAPTYSGYISYMGTPWELVADAIAGIKVRSDKIWAGVKNSDETGISPSISILANADVTDGYNPGSKIVLDASVVQVDGTLRASFLKIINPSNRDDSLDGTVITPNSITTNEIAANAISTAQLQAGSIKGDRIATGAITTDKIETSAITADKLSADAIDVNKLTVKKLKTNEDGNPRIQIEDDHMVMLDANDLVTLNIHGEDLSQLNISGSTSGTFPSSAVHVTASNHEQYASSTPISATSPIYAFAQSTHLRVASIPQITVYCSGTSSADFVGGGNIICTAYLLFNGSICANTTKQGALFYNAANQTRNVSFVIPATTIAVPETGGSLSLVIYYQPNLNAMTNGHIIDASCSATISANSCNWSSIIKATEIANNGLRIKYSGESYFEMKFDTSTSTITMQNGDVGIKLNYNQMQMLQGGTWYNCSRDTNGYLKLTT